MAATSTGRATTRRRPQDFTGREADRLAKERDEASVRDAAQLTMVMQAEQDEKAHEVIALPVPPAPPEPELGAVVEVKQPYRTVRINSTLDQMTFGAGNHYDFEQGRTYKLPA